LIALEGFLLERGELDQNEYDVSADAPRPIRPASLAELSYAATGQGAPRRQPGDRVRARNINPAGHTRLPRYARGKRGVVHRYHGDFPFADTNAARLGDQPQPLYSVAFTARELWGDGASVQDTIYLDLWESYLEPE
jgi:nitrile hydratase